MTAIGTPDPAELYDTALRGLVASRTDPHVKYLVQLDAYGQNGICQCTWFQCKLEPLLAKKMTPEDAHAQKLVPLPKTKQVRDCLRCAHIIDFRDETLNHVIKAIHTAAALNRRA